MLAATEGLPSDEADRLAAITRAVVSLTLGAATSLSRGDVRQTVVDMDGGVLLITAAGNRAYLAILASPGCDLAQTGYETALLAQRVAALREPHLRTSEHFS